MVDRGEMLSGVPIGGISMPDTVIGCILFRFKTLVTDVCFKICDVNEIINTAINVRHGGLIRCKSPFIIDNELEGMFAPLQVMNVGEVITRSVHGYLARPSIESSRNVHIPTTVLPSKYCGDYIVVSC